MDGGGFARAIGTQKAEEVTFMDGQRQVIHRDIAAAIDLAQIFDRKGGGGHASVIWTAPALCQPEGRKFPSRCGNSPCAQPSQLTVLGLRLTWSPTSTLIISGFCQGSTPSVRRRHAGAARGRHGAVAIAA